MFFLLKNKEKNKTKNAPNYFKEITRNQHLLLDITDARFSSKFLSYICHTQLQTSLSSAWRLVWNIDGSF